jgi:hypothetical protein
MKIRLQKTFELTPDEVKALKIAQEDMGATDQTFREWFASYHITAGDCYIYERISEYGGTVE